MSAWPGAASPAPGERDRSQLSIGEVAARTGHTPSGLRHWESVGLLPPPPRVAGKRRYPASVVDRIAVIDLARRAGFTLAQIQALVDGVAAGTAPPAQWAALADEKLTEIDALIARAQATRQLLEALRRCDCPTLEACAGRSSALVRCPAPGRLGSNPGESLGGDGVEDSEVGGPPGRDRGGDQAGRGRDGREGRQLTDGKDPAGDAPLLQGGGDRPPEEEGHDHAEEGAE